jgi:DNA-binding response OmpR family regulator
MADSLRVLAVDDEAAIRRTVGEGLQRAGHTVVTASSGEEALDILRETPFDVAVVDLNLGGEIDGLDILEAIRWRWPATAVLILTAHGSLDSAITAIRDGVDDYLLKPARPAEVRDAVRRAARRRATMLDQRRADEARVVQRGQFLVKLDEHVAMRAGQPLDLTPQEMKLLVHLMENAPRVSSPTELVQVVRDYKPESLYEARQVIKWYVHRLRQAVEPDPSSPRHIVNMRGVGYKFEE